MTMTAARSLHAAIPVPPPPRGDGEAAASHPSAPSSSAAAPSRSPGAANRLASVLDLDGDALDAAGFARPQTSRPPRPRPVQPPTSVDDADLRRQRLWALGATTGFGVTSVAVIASWFL